MGASALAREPDEDVREWNGEASGGGLRRGTVSLEDTFSPGLTRNKCHLLVQQGKVPDQVNVIGTDDVRLVVERGRICCDVDFTRRVKQEGLVHRALLRVMGGGIRC